MTETESDAPTPPNGLHAAGIVALCGGRPGGAADADAAAETVWTSRRVDTGPDVPNVAAGGVDAPRFFDAAGAVALGSAGQCAALSGRGLDVAAVVSGGTGIRWSAGHLDCRFAGSGSAVCIAGGQCGLVAVEYRAQRTGRHLRTTTAGHRHRRGESAGAMVAVDADAALSGRAQGGAAGLVAAGGARRTDAALRTDAVLVQQHRLDGVATTTATTLGRSGYMEGADRSRHVHCGRCGPAARSASRLAPRTGRPATRAADHRRRAGQPTASTVGVAGGAPRAGCTARQRTSAVAAAGGVARRCLRALYCGRAGPDGPTTPTACIKAREQVVVYESTDLPLPLVLSPGVANASRSVLKGRCTPGAPLSTEVEAHGAVGHSAQSVLKLDGAGCGEEVVRERGTLCADVGILSSRCPEDEQRGWERLAPGVAARPDGRSTDRNTNKHLSARLIAPSGQLVVPTARRSPGWCNLVVASAATTPGRTRVRHSRRHAALSNDRHRDRVAASADAPGEHVGALGRRSARGAIVAGLRRRYISTPVAPVLWARCVMRVSTKLSRPTMRRRSGQRPVRMDWRHRGRHRGRRYIPRRLEEQQTHEHKHAQHEQHAADHGLGGVFVVPGATERVCAAAGGSSRGAGARGAGRRSRNLAVVMAAAAA
eukprot:ctg_42.g3